MRTAWPRSTGRWLRLAAVVAIAVVATSARAAETGSWGGAHRAHPRALELARRFAIGVVLGGAGPRGSLRREATEAGIPAIIYEAGEPLRFQAEEIERGVEGVHNVMVFLGLVPGAPGTPPLAVVFPRTSWIRVPLDQGGVFFPTVALGARLTKGTVLGTVTRPDTDEVHDIVAQRDGTVIGMAVPQVVLSGYGLFHLGYGAE